MKMEQGIILLLIVAVLASSTGLLSDLRGAGQGLDFSWLLGGSGTGLVDVDKTVDFVLADGYGGSALTSKTLKVYEHTGTGLVLRHTLTTDGTDGTVATPRTYKSGTVLSVYYESSNDKQWWTITVPQMNPSDAESATVNTVNLDSFAIGTYSSDSFEWGNGTAIADAGTINLTAHGSDTPDFKYSLANTGNDNTGIISSYDPLYGMNFDVIMWFTLSGTGYEKVLVYGNFQSFTMGTTRYFYIPINDYTLTKHKVGWDYKSRGTWDTTFWIDGSGLSGADSVTWQIYVYGYSDPAYFQEHGGDYGYEKVELAEHTLTIIP